MITVDIIKTRKAMKHAEEHWSRIQEECAKQIHQARCDADAAWKAYYNALEANGQCGICEERKTECEGHIAT